MRKLSKLQKKWVKGFNQGDNISINLLMFLHKLKVLNKIKLIQNRSLIIAQVSEWADVEYRRKARHNSSYDDDKPKYGPPPRSIKPTRARS